MSAACDFSCNDPLRDRSWGDLLWHLIWSLAVFLKKVFVSFFDLVDAAFEPRGVAMTSTPSRQGPTFASAAQENEASSSSLLEGVIPRYEPATRVGRFNYYAVKRGYKCGLYFNWPDSEC